MPQRRPLAVLVIALVTLLLASGCASQTRLVAGSVGDVPSANPTPLQVTAPLDAGTTSPPSDETIPGDDDEPIDLAFDEPMRDEGVSGAELTDYDRGVYQVSLPSDWMTMTTAAEVEPILNMAAADGLDLPRQAINQFTQLLDAGDAIIALDFTGDNINIFRQWGPGSLLVEHELIVEQMELQLSNSASNVELSSQALMMGSNPGVLIEGSYELEGQPVSLYQFSTHSGAHLYYLTVTLMSGPDRDLAIDIFRTLNFE